MNKLHYTMLCILLTITAWSFFSPSQSHASEKGTKEEAVAMVDKVIRYYHRNGLEKTYNAISIQKAFVDRDLYAFMLSMDGIMVAHSKLLVLNGKNQLNLQDADGIYFVRDRQLPLMRSKQSGWVNYKFYNPRTKKVDRKVSYIKKVNDRYFVGVGVYLGSEEHKKISGR